LGQVQVLVDGHLATQRAADRRRLALLQLAQRGTEAEIAAFLAPPKSPLTEADEDALLAADLAALGLTEIKDAPGE
jgi:hypothetical protein